MVDDMDSTRTSNTPDEKSNLANVYVVLIAGQSNKNNSLLYECLGKGVLDSGCTKTVVWMNEYISTLSSEERKAIVETSSDALFKFGDGVVSKSLKSLVIPVVIGNSRCAMKVEVVKEEIPLLISKASMKKMEMRIDFKQDVAHVNSKEISLGC